MSSNEEIKRAIEELDSGWELKEGKIVKSFQFPSFMKAIEFVNDVAKIAEKAIIIINWTTIKLSLKSFAFLQNRRS